ncbi:hypothetical protein BV511_26315 [Methylorubrum extorquens]|uniref:hypothetical protein n=1 Tax=Methylorubrum extorquens TaxID=408 RepID=UPI0009729F81|nr:hypothetical protein [Methylorubrum extorquens]APX83297.1 hypothetical protein BV511_00040 [Methylorubrum extorquens]APX87936.1 hypothetical protein BV511_26315 [Methylorubrum extorquens]
MPAPTFSALAAAVADGTSSQVSRRSRSRAAAGRLEAARHGFERSLITLRRTALDAIDSGDLASLTLRVCGDRRRAAGGEGAA